ncbi:CHAT domain-containing protein [Streptomyces sp. RB6PN25]|uniref:CHAT domain-containing protein n=1 Tax=Streptomyces humicola TaxID=2953240 RepID=A0ABT1PXA8_9ACTN|nr:CHAT domain-containing protein [Streptomyces humicola]MCQ4082304.1 CHAT domain-containing protein [Streptomyces humicola]
MRRFVRAGDIDDLLAALDASRTVVTIVPEDDPFHAKYRLNVATDLARLGRVTGDDALLDEAAAMARDCVEEIPAEDPDRPLALHKLAVLLTDRYLRTGDTADLDESVAHRRAAVEGWRTVHDTDPAAVEDKDRRLYLSGLIHALRLRAERSGDDSDPYLTEAIKVGRGLLDGRADSPLAPGACTLYEQAAAQPNAKPESRVTAAYAWGRARAELGEWDRALQGFTQAVELLPLLALVRLGPADQAALLNRLWALAAEGAGCALQAGQPEKALELLEYGRAVLAEQLTGADDDLVRLRTLDPALAERFEHLRDGFDGQRPATRHQSTVISWNETLRAIRDILPGFLEPPPIRELIAGLGERTVVFVNTSAYRSDCIVLRSGTITVVPLPEVTREEFTNQASRMLKAVAFAIGGRGQEARRTGEEDLREFLEWLWTRVARPALEAAGFLTGAPAADREGRELPRLWWIPCGFTGHLPLHAAGSPGATGESVLDHVVPSYAPTLRSLLREPAPASPGEAQAPLLLVAAPQDGLPGIDREIDVLRRLVATKPLVGEDATAQAVKEHLAHHPVVHFACHGVLDLDNPGESRLLLPTDPGGGLTVRDLTALRLPRSRLAYLSACSTAFRPISALMDEPLTLSTAIHLAGFHNVIGSQWTVNDLVAVRLVRTVYAQMRSDEDSGAIDPERSAAALRRAVMQLRRMYPELPSLWAPHVHVGG